MGLKAYPATQRMRRVGAARDRARYLRVDEFDAVGVEGANVFGLTASGWRGITEVRFELAARGARLEELDRRGLLAPRRVREANQPALRAVGPETVAAISRRRAREVAHSHLDRSVWTY
jgi:hypothetical protein